MKPRSQRSRERDVVRGMPATPAVGIAGLVELFPSELSQRLEHRVSSRAVGTILGNQHRLRDQARDRVHDLHGRDRRRRRPRTAAAASNVPAKMPSRSKTVRSLSSSSWYDHSTVARNVWWRSTRPRRLPVRRRNRSSRWAAISVGLIEVTRAAASSIASGMPSTRRQISPTAAHCAVGPFAIAPASEARSANRRDCRAVHQLLAGRRRIRGLEDRTRTTRSPSTSSASRLVASTVTADTRAAPPPPALPLRRAGARSCRGSARVRGP